ncbi:MAG: hypothetical protein R3Y36_03875, partial [Spirochaetales bacterium]
DENSAIADGLANTENLAITDGLANTENIAITDGLANAENSAVAENPIIPSRSITIFDGDQAEILLPGQNWIYLGEVESGNPKVIGFSNRLTAAATDTLFIFRGENVGTALLHFYKQDILGNTYIDEYIEIIVEQYDDTWGFNEYEYADGVSSEPEVLFAEDYIIEENASAGLDSSAEELLIQAQTAYDEQRYADSIALLDEYTMSSVDSLDKVLFLYGQNYEAGSDQKNIRQALDMYQRIVDSFPSSSLWDEAQKRSTYIKRFYFSIR